MTRLTIFKDALVVIRKNDDGTITSTIGRYLATHTDELQATFNAWKASRGS